MKFADLKRQVIESLLDELDQHADYGEIMDSLGDKDLEGFCEELDFLLKDDDPKAKALYDTLKDGWQKEYGDVKVEKGTIDVKDFHPTQGEIFTEKSLVPFLNGEAKVGDEPSVKAVLKEDSPTIDLGKPLVVCRVGGKNYIIDGHHRWSKVCMFNPNAKMNAYIIDGDKTFKDAEDVLKFAQGTLALFTEKSPIHEQNEDDTNIYRINRSNFNRVVSDSLLDNILEIIATSPVTKGKVTDKESLCDYLWKNKQALPKPFLDTDREYMPQISECRSFRVNRYKGNLLESLRLFNRQNPKLKVVRVCESNNTLRIFAK